MCYLGFDKPNTFDLTQWDCNSIGYLQSIGDVIYVTVFSSAIAEYRCVVINWCRIAHRTHLHTIKLCPRGRKYTCALTFWCLCWHLQCIYYINESYQSWDKPDVILLMIQSEQYTSVFILCYHSVDHYTPQPWSWSLICNISWYPCQSRTLSRRFVWAGRSGWRENVGMFRQAGGKWRHLMWWPWCHPGRGIVVRALLLTSTLTKL